MEHGASVCVEEQLHTEITIKTEVEEVVQSTSNSDVEITVNYNVKQEPGLPQLVKSEPALLVKEEVVEVSWLDMDWQQHVEATRAPTIADSLKVAAGSMVQNDELNIKDELGDKDMDIGPTVLQLMDLHYSTKQPDTIVVEQESTINVNNVNATPCGGVKEETSEHECRGAQHRGGTQPRQRAQPRLYSCDKCPKNFKWKSALHKHCRRVHGTESHECTECDLKYRCAAHLARHIREEHNKNRYECTGCKKMCVSKQMLRNHLTWCRELTSAGSPRQFTCSNCGKNYKTRWFWQKHEDTCKLIRPTASDTSAVASTSTQQHGVGMVKEEPADGELELGPVVFQHMDCNYRPYKPEPQLD